MLLNSPCPWGKQVLEEGGGIGLDF